MRSLKPYALGLVALSLAVLLRLALDPVLGDTLPLVTLFGAVAAAVWLGGYRPAILVALLGYFVCAYLFIEPRGSLGVDDAGKIVGLLAYLFTCAIIIAFGEAMLVAQSRASGRRELLEREKANQLVTARLLASIVESSDDAIISKSLDSIIQTWNAAAERLFGFTAAEAVGRNISIIIPPDRIADEDLIISRLKQGQRIEHFETERVRSDGQRLLVSLTISPIKDESGKVVGASKIVRDVTRQRQTEERQRELLAEAAAANAKFHAFFEQGALFAGLMSVDGILLEANRLSWEGCGYTREQVIGKPFWEGPWWSPSPALAEQIKKASAEAAAGQIFHTEMSYFVADGSERTADITIQPITDETGRVLFVAPTGTDITDRKRAEAERKRLEDNLRRLAQDLSEADQRKDEFLATLAHELRNPLAPLVNMLEVLKRANGDSEMVRLAQDTMERQLGQMVRLVDDLLDLNRVTHDRLELRQDQVELSSVIHQAVEACRPLADSAGHQLTVILPDEPIYLHADPARLAQVFGNLLNNSCKYTLPGGKISLTARRLESEVLVTVKDTGTGIPPDKLDSIFDMFSQVDRPPEHSKGGLGIGLTLVKRLVQMHGGNIKASSAGDGQGSEFQVRLPILTRPSSATPKPTVAQEPSTMRRILVVDDNQDSADSLAMLLEMTGNETHLAHDGVEALEAVEKLRPEVVLLDIGLPKLSGHEVCRRIREQAWGKGVVLIALTGWGQEEDRRKSQEAGFDGHLVKPVDYNALLELLSSLSPSPQAPQI